jgi:hypothetical protein
MTTVTEVHVPLKLLRTSLYRMFITLNHTTTAKVVEWYTLTKDPIHIATSRITTDNGAILNMTTIIIPLIHTIPPMDITSILTINPIQSAQ